MKGKLWVFSSIAMLAVVFSVVTTGAFQAATKSPDLKNKPYPNKKKANFWVHRRQDGDPDTSGALAVVIHIKSKPLGPSDEVLASITRYNTYGGGLYDGRQSPIFAVGTIIGNSAENSRERETLTLRDHQSDDPIGYLTFYKGRTKGKAVGNRQNTRAIFRWDSEYVNRLKPKPNATAEKKSAVGCDEPPVDDPMEEEDMTYEEAEEIPIPGEELTDPTDP